MKKTKAIITVGPSSRDINTLNSNENATILKMQLRIYVVTIILSWQTT